MTPDKVGVGWQLGVWLEVPSAVCGLDELEVGGTSTRARLLHSGMVVALGSCEPGAMGTEVQLFRNKVLVCGPSHPPCQAGKRTDSAHAGARAFRPGSDSSLGGPARPASRRSPRSPAWSRVGAGKLRSPTLGVVSCISSRLPGLSATISQLTGFISAPCTNAPNQKGKSGDCPPFRGCCLKFLV